MNMGKKVLGILMCLCALGTAPAYALSVDLSLFRGGLSVLDSLFLIGAGLTLIGVLLLCIALFKKEKSVDEIPVEPIILPEEDAEEEELEEESVEETEIADEEEPVEEPLEETLEETPETMDEEAIEEAELAEEEEATEEEVVEEVQEVQEVEEIEEKTYPTLTLTGLNNTEFKILPLKESVTLGRRPGNDLIFTDTTISGVHCEITIEDDILYLEDKGSTNGTYLNREKITEKTEIHKGDILAMGKLEFKISI